MKPLAKFASSLLLACFTVAAITALCPAEFWGNDDTIMQAILSGSTSGEPTPYAIFINIIIGYLICGLFVAFPTIPWWFVFLKLCLVVAVTASSYAVISLLDYAQKGRLGRWLPPLLALLASTCCFLYFICQPSFTFTAVSLASASISCYLAIVLVPQIQKGERRGLTIATVMLMFLSCLIRFNCGLIGIAFIASTGILVVIRQCLSGEGRDKNSTLRALLPVILSIGLAAIGWGVNNAAYSTEEWSEFQDINHARSVYTDFHHYAYDEHEDLYQSMGWNENLYSLVHSWFFMDERIDKEAFEVFAGEGKTPSVRSLVSNFAHGTGMFSHTLPLAAIAVLIAQLALVLIVIKTKWPSPLAIVPAAAALCGCLFLWFVSRTYVVHVMLCTLVPASVFCLALVSSFDWETIKPPSKLGIACIVLFAFSIAALFCIDIPRFADTRYRYFAIAVVPIAACFGFWLQAKGQAQRNRRVVTIALIAICITMGLGAIGEIESDYGSRERIAAKTADLREYAATHADDLFVFYNGLYSYDGVAMTPKNAISWGGWEYYAPWRSIVASEMGYPDGLYIDMLLDEDVYFMTYGEKYIDHIKLLLAERSGEQIQYELVEKTDNGMEVFKFYVT